MFKLDNDLLSHGETPHYHRRYIVSLLSSGWDQVVPMLYGRQAIRCCAFVSPHGVKGGKSDSCLSDKVKVLQSHAVPDCRSMRQAIGPNCLGVIWSSHTGN